MFWRIHVFYVTTRSLDEVRMKSEEEKTRNDHDDDVNLLSLSMATNGRFTILH